MPRPFDADAKAAYIARLATGRQPLMAAEDIGFTWQTIRSHVREDPDFAEACQIAELRATEPIAEVMYDKALEGEQWAVKEVLHNRNPERWMDRKVVQQQLTGPGGGPIQVVTMELLREIVTDGDTRADALAFLHAVPAIEAVAHE